MHALVINVRPEEGIALTVDAKHPGTKAGLRSLALHLDYRTIFGGDPPEAYERLLRDCMPGDRMLLVRTDDAKASWAQVTDVLHT